MMLGCWLRHHIAVASVAVELGQLAGGTKHRFGMTCLLCTASRSPSTSVTFELVPCRNPKLPIVLFFNQLRVASFSSSMFRPNKHLIMMSFLLSSSVKCRGQYFLTNLPNTARNRKCKTGCSIGTDDITTLITPCNLIALVTVSSASFGSKIANRKGKNDQMCSAAGDLKCKSDMIRAPHVDKSTTRLVCQRM